MKLQRRAFFKQSVAGLAVLPFFASTKSDAAPMGNAQFVDVDGIRTSYFEGGSGEPMVLVHGGHYAFQEYPGEVTEQMVSFIKG